MSHLDRLFAQFMDLVEEVPFGNSNFQNRLVIVDGERTPARAYRHAALRLRDRLQALREASYAIRKKKIEIAMLNRDRQNEPDELKRQMIDLEIERQLGEMPYTRKLVKDAVREIESLWPVIQRLGKLSREQFEDEEAEHYRLKHGQTITLDGDLFSLIEASGPMALGGPDFEVLLQELGED